MKKTLIALAALAATTAFAQVTITGGYAAGYRLTTAASGANASGFGLDGANVTFTATEDLGGGMSLTAKQTIDNTSRAGIAGGDSYMTLKTGVGAFTYDLGNGSDFITGGAHAVGGQGMDGKVFSGLSAADAFIYAVPLTSAITLTYVHGEPERALGTGGAGQPTSGATQRANELRLAYTAGGLFVHGRYAMYDQAATTGNTDNRVRLGAKYDFGSFKLGGAYEQRKFWNAGNRTDMGVSAGTTMGALTLGANYVTRKWDNVPTSVAPGATATPDGTVSGYSLSSSYALSKRTSVNVNYASWNAGVNDANRSNETNVVLSHSF